MSLLDMYTDMDYPLCLEASGDGEVCESSFGITLDKIFGRYKKKCGGFPAQISLLIRDTQAAGLDYGFTSIDTAFLERLETLKELGIPDSVTHIEMTERLERILKENNTLIRGTFDQPRRLCGDRGEGKLSRLVCGKYLRRRVLQDA